MMASDVEHFFFWYTCLPFVFLLLKIVQSPLPINQMHCFIVCLFAVVVTEFLKVMKYME